MGNNAVGWQAPGLRQYIPVLYLDEPPNFTSLTGDQYAGLNSSTVFFSALNTWKMAGNANTGVTFDFTNETTVNNLAIGDLTMAPGLVQIPVCSLWEANQVWMNDKDNSGANPVRIRMPREAKLKLL